MRVLFLLTRPMESPGERYRVFQFIPHFESQGIECRVESLFSASDFRDLYRPGFLRKTTAFLLGCARRVGTLLRSGRFDAAVIYGPPLFLWPGAVEAMLGRAGLPFIVDLDDACYLPSPGSVNPLASLLRSPARLARTLARADCVVAGNHEIAAFARRHARRVEVVPTCVDTDYFRPRALRDRRREEVVVGWMGSHSTAAYLDALPGVFEALAGRLPQARIRVVGAEYRHPKGLVESRPWRLETEREELSDFDIGIMPMPDDEWARGKCGLKILQYMAAGIPVVASPVGVNRDIVEDGRNGLLAGNTREWLEKLLLLARSPELRERFASAGRRTVEERYSLEKWAPRWAGLLRSVN